MRLAPPKTDTPEVADEPDDPTTPADPSHGPTTPTADKPDPTHVVTPAPGPVQPAQPQEREIAFSLMTSMSDTTTQDAVRRLLLELSNAADDGKISWAQIQVKVVVADDAADVIEQGVRDTGTTPSSRPV